MDQRYRNFFACHVISLIGLSEQKSPRSALIAGGGELLASGFSKGTGTEYDTSPIFEALFKYAASDKGCKDLAWFCSYFPSLEEFIALYSTEIRTVYYMGSIQDEKTVRFLNNCQGPSFEIIKLEVEK